MAKPKGALRRPKAKQVNNTKVSHSVHFLSSLLSSSVAHICSFE